MRGFFGNPVFHLSHGVSMKERSSGEVVDGARCKVIGGVHVGRSGTVRDIKTGKTGHVSITVVQSNGVRFKTLAKNVVVLRR
jgi:ribosomal protein S4E